jgi:outer membrane protein assembly factor BamB
MIALWLGCTPPESHPPADRQEPSATGDTGPSVQTGDTAPTSTGDTAVFPTGDTGAPIDCTALPATGTFVMEHDYVPGFEDFTFSADGYLWGISTETFGLYRIPYLGPAEPLRPNVSTYARGTRFLPDGVLVSVDYPNNALIRIDPVTYASTLVTGALSSPNGVAIGEDGLVFVSQSNGSVRKVDPLTGEAPVFVESPVSNDGITFAPDHRRLYLNSDATGGFMALEMDEDEVIVDPLALVATLPGSSDGMTMDACGNAYVVQISQQEIWRVHPDGTFEKFVDLPTGGLVVAANFGPGTGGWARDHLFLADLYHGLYEFDAGVEGKWEPHYPR